jgi:S-adenosylmethionine-diacylglycerol 3-amino-3-carboxypropyl transferase
MGRLGRDPSFFAQVHGRVAVRLLARARHALRDLDPADNPYLQWITCGRFNNALPHALREENFELIRMRLNRLEWRHASVGNLLSEASSRSFDRFNLSDIFEYLTPEASADLFAQIARTGRPGGRVAYWNMLARRRRPRELAHHLVPLAELGRQLHRQDKAFFYSAFRVDAIQ